MTKRLIDADELIKFIELMRPKNPILGDSDEEIAYDEGLYSAYEEVLDEIERMLAK